MFSTPVYQPVDKFAWMHARNGLDGADCGWLGSVVRRLTLSG